MPRNIVEKTLWDWRRSLLAWTLGIAAVAAMYAAFYPLYHQPALIDSLKSMPVAVKATFGIGDMSSPAGYLQSVVFGLVVTLLVILFTVTMGVRAIAGEEEAGTLDLLLAQPITRIQVVLQRFAALVVATCLAGALTLLALLAVAGPAQLRIGAGNLAAMVVQLILLGLCFGALALGIGAATGQRSAAYLVTAVIGVLTYLANTLAPQVDAAAWLQNLSPFHYYSAGEPLRHGLQPGDAGILLVLTILLVAAGTYTFNRRDVTV